jgi:heat-inducible transcriptional repressor
MENRTLRILEAIVDEYIRTGEAVGSKLIAEKLDNAVSSATIRNEMAALEQQGYLEHTHTSSGRLPTYQGLRLYIEKVMSPAQLPDEEKEEIDRIFDNIGGATDDEIIDNASRALADITKCAIVSTNTVNKFSVITKVDVIPTGKRMYVLLLITSEGNIRNRVCRLSFDLTNEQMNFFTQFVNENLKGVNLDELSDEYIDKLTQAMGGYMMTLSPLLKAVVDISAEMQQQVEFSGEKNLLTCSDFSNTQIATILDGKNELCSWLDDTFSGIQIKFGAESDTFAVTNSSLIAASFNKDGRKAGSFGVIGPVRLDYKKLIPYIEYFSSKVTDALSAGNDEEEKNEEKAEIKAEEIKVDPKDLEIADLKDKLLRTMAEFDNYRKRTAKERMELSPEITARNLTEFLPVMDNLDRALAAECKDPDYKKGVEMIHESFVTALQNLGVEVIESDGAQFNPSYHQAVQQVEDDSKEEGTIAATFQKGYKIGEKVLRFAMVAVVK